MSAKSSIRTTPLRIRAMPSRFKMNPTNTAQAIDWTGFARGVVQMPDAPRVAVTDFYQLGTSSHVGRFSMSTDVFLIDHSNEQVYIPDDGSFEFKGPSRAYGYEAKMSAALTRHLSLNAGLTKIANAFFRGGDHRLYVDSAPHFVANAGLTLSGWHGWSGSLRMRAINHYRHYQLLQALRKEDMPLHPLRGCGAVTPYKDHSSAAKDYIFDGSGIEDGL